MGVLPGSLATSPTQTMPSDVVRVLGKLALEGASAYVHIRSGIDSLLGDTHLAVVGGKLHVVARKTSLDPLEDVQLLALPEIDEDGYRSVLKLRTTAGDKRVEVGATEENAVHALIGALPAAALVEVVALVDHASLANARGELLSVLTRMATETAPIADLDDARGALLGVLGGRLGARRAKLKAQRARAATGKRSARPAPARALHAEVGHATTDDDGDGVPDPTRIVPEPRRAPAERPPDAPRSAYVMLLIGVALMLVVLMVINARAGSP